MKELKKQQVNKNECLHIWKDFGRWDGVKSLLKPGEYINIGGVIGKCLKCGKIQEFTWEDWRKLIRENKVDNRIKRLTKIKQ